MKNPKILFMGTPLFAAESLKSMISAGFEILGVVCQPDKEVGRGKNIEEPETKKLARINNIPVYQPEAKEGLTKLVQEIEPKPELIIVAAYGKIIPKEVLDIPKHGSLNIHGSILPKFRGSSCIAQSILEGDQITGITIMEIDEKMDAGNIISTVEVEISNNDTTVSLTEKLARAGAKEIVRVIPLWIEDKINSCAQCHTEATYCKLIRKEDGKIDWSKPANEIEKMTRAYYPWPTAFTYLNNKLLKIIKAEVVAKNLKPGELLIENKKLFVGTGKMALEVITIQPEGKKEMAARDFLNGNQDLNGKMFL